MTIKDVEERLSQIRSERLDAEVAHSLEDSLHQLLLASIAEGTCEDPVECAKLALTSQQISFPRWCA